ncbi:hypothetical protein, conserved [Babesia bigemina]|uniref:Uncharacterized protein n=1 Tax=Babesia bigemina TaxID=5866 RepID=A0A061D9Y6_BABBI|nr:hypothetical protein, conserved [Babesia bigemina]CDR97526.1 hypothetical protein, conserved [Babesia bigemina]|eukprot:XP_012769712.1 hypothetical protein, conserved [Babesia bigemina]
MPSHISWRSEGFPGYDSVSGHFHWNHLFRNGDSLFSVVSAWKCVLRMFHVRSRYDTGKEITLSLFDIIESSDDVGVLKQKYEQFKTSSRDFPDRTKGLVYDLFERIKFVGSFPLHKAILVREILVDVEKDVVEEALYHSMSSCSDTNQANSLILLHIVLKGEESDGTIPPIAALHDIYKEANVDPEKAIAEYKRALYKKEIDRVLGIQMEQRSKTDPPVPPPMARSATAQKNRRTELVRLFGHEILPEVTKADSSIDIASKTMLKPTWLAEFFNDARTYEPPTCGWSVLMLERAECYKLYNEVINGKLEEVKERILVKEGAPMDKNLQEMPKLAMLVHCRRQQICHICENITDWERIETDRIVRLKNIYSVDLTMRHGNFTPIHKPTIGGGKALPQPFYVNPEDDPNYDPPGSTPSSRLMNRMLRGDVKEEDKFVPTDLETRKKGLALVAKEMEPFEHLSPEQLSDLVLRNCKKEYELAEAIYRRRLRGRSVEDYHEIQLMTEGEHLDMPTSANINNQNGHKISKAHVSGNGIHSLREDYVITPNVLLTDCVVFLSMLEHLQWQFTSAVEMPVESLVNVHNMGDSITNPRPPQLLFVDPRCREAHGYTREYSASVSDAWAYRSHLNANVNGIDDSHNDGNVDKLLLFGDDPVFYLKDQEMLQHMTRHGVGLKIHSKVPGFTLPPEPTEHQKSTVFYRLNSSQPHVQQICSNCGYHVFSHTVKAHDGESLTSSEMDSLLDEDCPHCPICESQGCALSQVWVTGSRGYSPEPYPTPVEDEFCVE